MPSVRISETYCKGCALCVPACPRHILSLRDSVDRRGVHVAQADPAIACTGCGNCAAMCPDAAIEIDA